MSKRYCVDANIFITAWNVSYPRHIFPSLWEQLIQHQNEIVLIAPIFDEIEPILPADKKNLSAQEIAQKYPLKQWLINNGFGKTQLDSDVGTRSLDLEKAYQIRQSSRGASQNDITLIACAELTGMTVVTLEKVQSTVPSKKQNYKIPLICQERDVTCIDFVKMLENLGVEI